jgi:hypothetical protein
MEVEVKDTLPGIGTDVGHNAVAVGDPFLFGDLLDRIEKARHLLRVGVLELVHGRDVALGYHQDMGGGPGVDVPESEHIIGLEHLVRRDLSRDDLAEQAISLLRQGCLL